ncbi:DUF4375 domain-containing protein [Massilia sp. SR12]
MPLSIAEISRVVDALEVEINNGGFDQYFYNAAGGDAQIALEALGQIGAHHTAAILQGAMAKFPDGAPAIERAARQAQLAEISPESDAFESEDKAFLAYVENPARLVQAYSST